MCVKLCRFFSVLAGRCLEIHAERKGLRKLCLRRTGSILGGSVNLQATKTGPADQLVLSSSAITSVLLNPCSGGLGAGWRPTATEVPGRICPKQLFAWPSLLLPYLRSLFASFFFYDFCQCFAFLPVLLYHCFLPVSLIIPTSICCFLSLSLSLTLGRSGCLPPPPGTPPAISHETLETTFPEWPSHELGPLARLDECN